MFFAVKFDEDGNMVQALTFNGKEYVKYNDEDKFVAEFKKDYPNEEELLGVVMELDDEVNLDDIQYILNDLMEIEDELRYPNEEG